MCQIHATTRRPSRTDEDDDNQLQPWTYYTRWLRPDEQRLLAAKVGLRREETRSTERVRISD